MTVRLLEEHVVNQIAAGEVVERPASVVKELVENALDAGARAIDVFVQDGGRQRIRVRDDGVGMRESDALMALERHATSKIVLAEDLANVGTLGFRGEALPSIASVSRFTLVTREASEEAGTQIRVEGGTLHDLRPIGAPLGTEIDVRSLFYNVPARKKFLRSAETELAHVVETVSRLALARPDVGFGLQHGERPLLRAPAGDLSRRVGDVLGPDARALVDVDLRDGDRRAFGRVSPPGEGRPGATNALYLYVNGRWVKDQVLRRAIYQAYRDLVPKGRYPLVVLDVRVPRDQVDVNVHPTKAEVRFLQPHELTTWLADGLRAAILAGREDPRYRPARGGYQVDAPTLPLPVAWAPSPPAPALAHEAALPMGAIAPHPDDAVNELTRKPPVSRATVAEVPPSPNVHRWRAAQLIGCVRRRWLVLEGEEGIEVVDGGRLATALALRAGGVARRLIPARVTIAAADADRLFGCAEELGLDVHRFGPQEVAVRAVPSGLSHADPAHVLQVAVDALRQDRDPMADWVSAIDPAPLDVEAVALRTLLVSAAECGIEAPSQILVWENLPGGQ